MKTNDEKLKKIIPANGLGVINFGASRDEVEKIIGEPDEIEEHSYSDDGTGITEAWHYDDLELSLEFEEEENWRLITISVSSEQYEFHGKQIIGYSEDKLISLLKELNIDDYEVEELSPIENPSQRLISVEDLGINFWFDNDVLMEIQWCVLFKEDETIDWPVSSTYKV